MDTTIKPKVTAKDFFLHIGVIAALYVFATSFLSFMFDIINFVFPDRQAYYADPYSSGMRFALSTLIVSFPILLVLLRNIYKDLLANPAKRELTLRKWLIFLTLFITFVTVAVDLIVLLNTFLGGEISTRFLLKVVTVFIVAGGIFWTTLSDLRGVFFENPKKRKIALSAASIIVVAAVVWGFTVIGSPSSLRDLRDDNQRLSDLQNIQWQIVNHYQTKGTLPATLSDLNDPLSNYMIPKDPATDAPYEYRTIAATTTPVVKSATTTPTFELCGTFAKSSQDLEGKGGYSGIGRGVTYPSDVYVDPSFGGDNWKHDAGRACFIRTIDPLKYPIFEKPPRS
ncbi:MAG: DUF5671 domain-containing protein [Patescibacteria group bacterium]